MPLDHYIPQVHLRNFYSPSFGNRMYAIRKNDMYEFKCKSEDVCRTKDGSTNEYLEDKREIEEFLKIIEPKYNKSVDRLRNKEIDIESIYTIAGFVAYVMSCSPAAMRINSVYLRGAAENTLRILDEQGQMPRAPASFGSRTATDLLDANKIKILVDPKFPQSIGIETITHRISTFGNFSWDIIVNEEHDSPFFTSDFPIAIERSRDPRILNRVVPLRPDIAIRIRPNFDRDIEEVDLSFSKFDYRRRRTSRTEILGINRLIVQCAERLVFYREELPWIKGFVSKNRQFRIETRIDQLDMGDGILQLTREFIAHVPGHH